MRFVETDDVICFNESHGLFGTRLRYVEAPYSRENSEIDSRQDYSGMYFLYLKKSINEFLEIFH